MGNYAGFRSHKYTIQNNLLEKKTTNCLIVSVDGIGPSTSVLSGQRSTTELHALVL
jgi:hypothetical protein